MARRTRKREARIASGVPALLEFRHISEVAVVIVLVVLETIDVACVGIDEDKAGNVRRKEIGEANGPADSTSTKPFSKRGKPVIESCLRTTIRGGKNGSSNSDRTQYFVASDKQPQPAKQAEGECLRTAPMSKLYCIFAEETLEQMKGLRGKLAAQAGHAFLGAVLDAEERFPSAAAVYKDSDQHPKIVLVAPTVADLKKLALECYATCGVSLVTDAARTVFKQPTVTCLGIGPISDPAISPNLSSLKPLT